MVLDKLDRLALDVEKLNTEVAKLNTSDERKEIEIQELRGSSKKFKKLSGVSIKIRQRFLDVSRRDKINLGSTPLIGQGNMAAHDGDCIADSLLYTENLRNDHELYKKLYRLDPEQVSQLVASENEPAIKALDQHATYWSQKDRKFPKDYHEKFAIYVFEQAGLLAMRPNTDLVPELKTAYEAFLKAHGKEPKYPSPPQGTQ